MHKTEEKANYLTGLFSLDGNNCSIKRFIYKICNLIQKDAIIYFVYSNIIIYLNEKIFCNIFILLIYFIKN